MEKYKKFTYKVIYILIIAFSIYALFKLSINLLLPFVLSFVVTIVIYPASKKVKKKLKIPEPVSSFLIIIVASMLVIGLLILLLSVIIKELGSVTEKLLDTLNSKNNIIDILFSFTSLIEEKLPFLAGGSMEKDRAYSLLVEVLTDMLKEISQRVTGWAGGVIKNLPQLIVAFITFTLSLFYLVKDYDKISRTVFSVLPKRLGEVAVILKNDISQIFTKYLKSYGIILLVTFAELFSGLLILGVENSFVIALFVCLIDILPIVGSGIILIPWGITLLVFGNIWQGAGIIVLAVVIYIVRQLIEPKIISVQMNIHPLLTLASMYVGLKIQGFLGMIFAPILAFLVKTLYSRIKNEKNVEMPKKL